MKINKMQILVDIRLLGRGVVSGIEEYTRNLLQSLLNIDRANEYLLFNNSFFGRSADFAGRRRINWHLPNKLLDFSAKFFRLPPIDRFIKTDAVFSPHFNNLITNHAPRIVTFHDLSFIHHPYFFSRKQRLWHWLQDYRRQAKRAARIIAVSQFTKRDLVETLGVPEGKIEVIYSGIGAEFKKTAEPKRFDFPFWLYLGTLEPRKNVPAIIKAFNVLKTSPRFKDYRLVLAGRPGWLYSQIAREIHRSPFGRDIILTGPVATAEKIRLYSQAEVFIYPSFFEGFGFPPLEAQACGCPVVIADRASLPEVAGEGAVKVDPWKVGNLAEAVAIVSENNARRAELIAKGLANVKRFDWQETARATLNVIQHAV